MKSNTKKRLIAFMLCMVLVLSSAISAFADEGTVHRVPTDTVELSSEIMKDGVSQGTLFATIPGEAFQSTEDNATLQMNLQSETEESTVIENIQNELEARGITEYTIHQTIMGNVSFSVSPEANAQIPEKPIHFRFENTALDTTHAMGFVYDSSNNTTTLYELNENTLQFEEDVEMKTESIVVGCFDLVEKETEEALPSEEENINTVDTNTGYVIRTHNSTPITITVQHYLKGEESPLYHESTITLSSDKEITDLASLSNYTAESVVKVTNGTAENTSITGTIYLDQDQTFRVYYTATQQNVSGSVQMFDYYVNKGTGNSINSADNYAAGSAKNARFACGTTGYSQYASSYDTYRMINDQKYYINAWDRTSASNWVNGANSSNGVFGNRTGTNAFPATGIITGINYKTGALQMGKGGDNNNTQLYEPGFFTNTNEPNKNGARTGKVILSGYDIVFNQTGDTWEMTKVTHNGNDVTNGNAGSKFFPLDDIENRSDLSNYSEDGSDHNDFFGMRYDISFKLGNYLGALNYTFTGDDDLWVVYDANKNGTDAGKVILDLGGIHTALKGTVDLWTILLGRDDYNLNDKIKYIEDAKNAEKEHTLTILYMERGANVSNCYMNFTLPNSRIIETSDISKTNLALTKVNTSNNGLKDATFEIVNDNNTNDTQKVTSDEDGKLTFTNLKQGNTYTLTEKSAPSSYVKENSSWKVKLEGSPLQAVLYDTTGETVQEKNADGTYHIVNLTQEEHTQQSMDYNKTAHVTDWDARKYDIDITASSKITSQTTQETGGEANVMLVLDASGSMDYKLVKYEFYGKNTDQTRKRMSKGTTYYLKINNEYAAINYYRYYGWYVNNKLLDENYPDYEIYTQTNNTTRMDALKAAANQFIDNTAEKSPNSKIGISVFSSENYGCNGTSKELLQAGTNKDTLKSFINDLSANGGTKPAIGLDDAYNKLKAAKDSGDALPQYVILFTDGAPTGNNLDSSWDSNAKTASETTAKNLREMGVTVYTIGFALDNRAQTYLAGDPNNSKDYPGIASPGCAHTADTADSLLDIFNKISETITNNLEIHDATIVDAIDPRFVILDDDGNQITPDYLKNKPNNQVTLENGGTVYYENGIQYIKWTEQTLPKHSENKQWKQTIHVQAQTDYIGGNNVPTNISPDSKITTTEFGDTPLPQPKVNVKAELTLNDKEITIYKGDDVPTADTVLADMVQNYTKNTTSYGISKDSFTVQWYSSEQLEESEKINTAVIGTKVKNDTTYYLTVTYNAGTPSKESNTNTTITKDDGSSEVKYAGNETTYQVVATGDQNRGYGIYTIHVISGTINITKNLTDPAKEDHTFQFEVKCGDTVITVPITVKKGEKTATITNEDALNKLTALPRGTYTVTEKEDSNTGYILNDSAVNKNTNCENNSENKSVTFVLGNNSKDKENVIKDYTYAPSSGGTLGDVTFTNEKVIKNWDIVKVSTSSKDVKLQGAEFTLTDSKNTTYTGTSDGNGKITWKDANSESVPKLPGGTYTFKETKAPVGYAVNPETWTIKISSTNGYLKSITKADGTEITGTETNSIVHYYFEDEAVYALPSAGGTGIYLYMIGGMLLMFAAVWILYKNKCKEVLGK